MDIMPPFEEFDAANAPVTPMPGDWDEALTTPVVDAIRRGKAVCCEIGEDPDLGMTEVEIIEHFRCLAMPVYTAYDPDAHRLWIVPITQVHSSKSKVQSPESLASCPLPLASPAPDLSLVAFEPRDARDAPPEFEPLAVASLHPMTAPLRDGLAVRVPTHGLEGGAHQLDYIESIMARAPAFFRRLGLDVYVTLGVPDLDYWIVPIATAPLPCCPDASLPSPESSTRRGPRWTTARRRRRRR